MTTTIDRLPPTARQLQVLEVCKAKQTVARLGPTVREIAAAIGVNNVTGVVGHLRALERKGYIRRTPGVARGIEVLRD